MADKLRTQQQLEAMQNRYLGTGHADTTPLEWAINAHRDSLASYIGHPPMLQYMALGMGVTVEEMRVHCLDRMPQPIQQTASTNGARSNGVTNGN